MGHRDRHRHRRRRAGTRIRRRDRRGAQLSRRMPLAHQSDGSWLARVRIPRGLERGRPLVDLPSRPRRALPLRQQPLSAPERLRHQHHRPLPPGQGQPGAPQPAGHAEHRGHPSAPAAADVYRRVTDARSGLEHILVLLKAFTVRSAPKPRHVAAPYLDGIWRGHAAPQVRDPWRVAAVRRDPDNTAVTSSAGDALAALHLQSHIGVRSHRVDPPGGGAYQRGRSYPCRCHHSRRRLHRDRPRQRYDLRGGVRRGAGHHPVDAEGGR